MRIGDITSYLHDAERIVHTCKLVSASLLTVAAMHAPFYGTHLSLSESAKPKNPYDRPFVSVDRPGMKLFDGRIYRYGETGLILSSAPVYAQLSSKSILSWMEERSAPRGFAVVDLDNRLHRTEDTCVLSTFQRMDGHTFYQASLVPYLVIEKELFDQFVQTHEAMHCFFTPSIVERDDRLQKIYVTSLTEIASDLAAVIDYMRLTGNDAIMDQWLTPFRMSQIGDLAHSGIKAIQLIVKEIDPKAMMAIAPEDIPDMVMDIMHEHFYDDEHGYDLARWDSVSDLKRAHLNELRTREAFIEGDYDRDDVRAWQIEMSESLVRQLDLYRNDLKPEHLASIESTQQAFIEKWGVVNAKNPTPEVERRLSGGTIKGRGMMDHFVSGP